MRHLLFEKRSLLKAAVSAAAVGAALLFALTCAASAAAVRLDSALAVERQPARSPRPQSNSVGLAAWPGGRPYSSSSPFNEAISGSPAIAPESATMVQTLARAESEKGFVLTVGSWTVPTYFAGPSTPEQSVALKQAP